MLGATKSPSSSYSQLLWERWEDFILEWKSTHWICRLTMQGHWWQRRMGLELWREFWGKAKWDKFQNLKLTKIIFSPILVGQLTKDSTAAQWRIVFWIAFVVFNVTNLIYVIWASGEIQPWNDGALIKKNDLDIDHPSTSEDDLESPAKQIPQLKSDNYKWARPAITY